MHADAGRLILSSRGDIDALCVLFSLHTDYKWPSRAKTDWCI